MTRRTLFLMGVAGAAGCARAGRRLNVFNWSSYVAPDTIQLGVSLIHPNLPKPQALNQPATSLILYKNSRDQLPKSGLLSGQQ